MKIEDIMQILQEQMKVAIFATVDEDNKPHARHAHIGVANENGVFFMTHPKTNFYKQLQNNPHVAITAMSEDGYLIQVIRIEGKIREVGRERLEEILQDNPYVKHVYPNKSERQGSQVFQLYEGEGFYHSMTQGHRYVFQIEAK
ncbi:pyridoxamine 5'-phosphate oxidase family protein [Jeotgalibaca ciconiae]|uniref:Pyridoxamine 5'-phosphate oxidase family protein n=1 Tax=Jeotgalibaca ciconiae TaxID=2496265 RepID=A0A3Q9BJT5_9LACT|nr:pyridoxamine 5'-phosphate oxidase family protein [Jeotgalibaca ciconiae]AZP04026.1 pyridoxamine 5'-phosphate oxidase family protein [Jeotgalibaca ciconiae]